ncbi:hypothetical protein G6F56_007571 [Rhizopus delemar]|nr:hypothetical protein G6F56_007571 [Rhizopus delemar]
MFVVREKDKIRSILNCQRINQYIQCHYFKMEGVPVLRDIIESHDWICKIDLKDVYTVVPIHKDSRKYLSFLHQGMVYQYKSLPFGMSVAPRVFSKLMRFVIEPMRELGIRVVYYLDDICVLAQTKKEIQSNMQTLLKHLQTLGFIINQTKSQLTPMKTQEFLGFTFDTVTMKISVPYKKIEKMKSRIKQVMKTTPQNLAVELQA